MMSLSERSLSSIVKYWPPPKPRIGWSMPQFPVGSQSGAFSPPQFGMMAGKAQVPAMGLILLGIRIQSGLRFAIVSALALPAASQVAANNAAPQIEERDNAF